MLPKPCALISGPDLHISASRALDDATLTLFDLFSESFWWQLMKHFTHQFILVILKDFDKSAAQDKYIYTQYLWWIIIIRNICMTVTKSFTAAKLCFQTNAPLPSGDNDPEWDQQGSPSFTYRSSWGSLSFPNICFGGQSWWMVPQKKIKHAHQICVSWI